MCCHRQLEWCMIFSLCLSLITMVNRDDGYKFKSQQDCRPSINVLVVFPCMPLSLIWYFMYILYVFQHGEMIDLVNGDLEEVELSDADKRLNAQLIQEAQKASLESKHRDRRARRSKKGSPGTRWYACCSVFMCLLHHQLGKEARQFLFTKHLLNISTFYLE